VPKLFIISVCFSLKRERLLILFIEGKSSQFMAKYLNGGFNKRKIIIIITLFQQVYIYGIRIHINIFF
jgi:hypothetical protein